MITSVSSQLMRFNTNIRIALHSSNIFSSLTTILITFIFQPILETTLIVIIAQSLSVADNHFTIIASALISLAITIIQTLVIQYVSDKNSGIMQYNPTIVLKPHYWTGKIVVSVLPAIIVFIISTTIIEVIYKTNNLLNTLLTVYYFAALTVLSAIIMGISLALISFIFRDPYLISNITGLLLPITSAVVAPLSTYPTWLAKISSLSPFTHIITEYRNYTFYQTNPTSNIFTILGTLIIWPLVALAFRKYKLKNR